MAWARTCLSVPWTGPVRGRLMRSRRPATPAAVAYLARHLDRSTAAALAVVEAIDRLLWDKPSEITREVARRALAEVGKTDAKLAVIASGLSDWLGWEICEAD